MSLLTEQFADSKNFMARIELNRRFSTNPYPWTKWIFDQMKFGEHDNVLELGSGNAILWKYNLTRIKPGTNIILSDFSEGMLDDARNVLGESAEQFHYMVMDAQKILYPNDTFDMVVANLMIYLLQDQKKTISEVSRVLNRGGAFYATTLGKNNMKELDKLLSCYDDRLKSPLGQLTSIFGLENGAEQLNNSFAEVEMRKYKDSLEISETNPLVNYILSFSNNKTILKGAMLEGFREYIDQILEDNGIIKITKDTGIFIARTPL